MQHIVCSPALHCSEFQAITFSESFHPSALWIFRQLTAEMGGKPFRLYFFNTWKHIHWCVAFFPLHSKTLHSSDYFFTAPAGTRVHVHRGFGPNEAQNCSCVNRGPHSATLLADKCVPQCGAARLESFIEGKMHLNRAQW